MIRVLFIIAITGACLSLAPTRVLAEETPAPAQDYKQEAEAYFAANTDAVLQDIAGHGERGNWWMVKTKAETLLGTKHPEIVRLHKQAEDELAKEAKAKEEEARKAEEAEAAQIEAAISARITWDIEGETGFNDAEKRMSRIAARRAILTEKNCARVTTGYRSGSKKGAYYLTCDAKNGGHPFNIWFTPQQVKDGGALAVPKPYAEEKRLAACRKAIEDSVTHPSTVDLHMSGYSTKVGNNGNVTVTLPFTAQNSFGVKLRHEARCLIQPDGKTEVTIKEAGG